MILQNKPLCKTFFYNIPVQQYTIYDIIIAVWHCKTFKKWITQKLSIVAFRNKTD